MKDRNRSPIPIPARPEKLCPFSYAKEIHIKCEEVCGMWVSEYQTCAFVVLAQQRQSVTH